MVDRAESLAPPDLRLKIVTDVADLAQLDDAKLPDGARVLLQEEDPASAPANLTGQREFVFTRLAAPAAPALTFTLANGASATPSRNVYLSKSGFLWIGWPQIFQVTLNEDTPVAIADVVTHVGVGGVIQQMRIDWRRLGAATTPGQVLFTASDNALSVVSEAGDDGSILVNAYAVFEYP